MLTKLRHYVNTTHNKIIRYRTQRELIKEITKREARIRGLKVYIRGVDTSAGRTRAIEKMKALEIEISQLLTQLSTLRFG